MRRWIWWSAVILTISLGRLFPVAAHPVDAMIPGTWMAVPNSAIQAVNFNWPAGVASGSFPIGGYFSESTAAFDATRQALYIWGGGHGIYAGDEIYKWDAATLTWIRLTDPCLRTDPQGLLEATGFYPDANGQPDPQCPRSTHSYDALVYVPTIDSLCAMGLWATYPSASVIPRVTVCHNMTTHQWQRYADVPVDGQDRIVHAAYDPLQDLVWVLRGAGGWLASWKPSTNVWTQRSAIEYRWLDGTTLYDPKRQRLVFAGSGQFFYIPLASTGTLQPQTITATGATGVLQDWRPGFAFEPVSGKYVIHSGELRTDLNMDFPPTHVYVVDPDTWLITDIAPNAANTVVPHRQDAFPDGRSHTFRRFSYVPDLGTFFLVNSRASDPVYVYKPDLTQTAFGVPAVPTPPTTIVQGPLPWPMPTMADEKATYQRWGWTWQPNQEPNYPTALLRDGTPFRVKAPDIHGDTEGDDLWTSVMQYRRTGQSGFLQRAQQWAQYFRDGYRQCLNPSGVPATTSAITGYYETYCRDKNEFGLDHLWGWGLLAYYELTGDASYFTAAELIAGDVEGLYTQAVPGQTMMAFWGLRAGARHLLLATRLAAFPGVQQARWMTLRDKLIALWLQSPDWNATYGMYFPSQSQTDSTGSYGPGAYASGVRTQSALQIPWLMEALMQAFTATGNQAIPSRLQAMAHFVATYSLEPTVQYVCRSFGVNIVTQARLCSETYGPPITPLWDPVYTTAQVNGLVIGGLLSGDQSMLTLAKTFFNRGTKGVYNNPTQRTSADTVVDHFMDTRFDSSSQWLYYAYNKGELFYTTRLFLLGTPPVAPSHLSVTFP